MAKLLKPLRQRGKMTIQEKLACLNDFATFCEKAVIIDDKNGRKVPFILNRAQRIFASTILPHIFNDNPQPKTVVVLKARQMGYTTLILALHLYIMIKFQNKEYSNLNIKHFFHLGNTANEIIGEKLLPMAEGLHPSMFGDFTVNKEQRMFHCVGFKGQSRNNKVRFFTAGSAEAGRGGTHQILILDECAFYPNLGKIMNSVGSATPTSGLGLQVLVSTANGIDAFYDQVELAQRSPEMEFLFLPWFLMEDYVMPPDNVSEDSLKDYERAMISEMIKWNIPEHLHFAKIAWYRDHLLTKKGNDLSAMRQEFPTTWREPFINSDTPVFPTEKLLELLDKAEDPEDYLTFDNSGKPIKGSQWDIEVYKTPEPGRRYMMIIDPAFGGEEADNTAIRVIDEQTKEDCAVYATKDEMEDVSRLAYYLGNYYNRAKANIEANRGELLTYQMYNMRYSNFYYDRTRPINRKALLKSVGTKISRTTKEKGIERLKNLLNTGRYKPKDKETIQELLHFNYTGKGSSRKAEACGNKPDGTPYHDDRVMTLINWVLTLPTIEFSNEMNK